MIGFCVLVSMAYLVLRSAPLSKYFGYRIGLGGMMTVEQCTVSPTQSIYLSYDIYLLASWGNHMSSVSASESL